MTSRRPPLAVVAGLLAAGSVLGGGAVVLLGLTVTGTASSGAVGSTLVGTLAGLCLCSVTVVVAHRHAARLRFLRQAALRRLHDPARPVEPTARPAGTVSGSELNELARALEALHVRVRVGERVGEQHRRDAETAGAGVLELLAGLVAAEEAARGQLAAELHDTVAQSLMIARSLIQARSHTADDLIRLGDYVEDAEEQVRAVMARTRPPALRDGDLASAVGVLRLDMQTRYGLTVSTSWPEEPHPLPLASAVTLYRFFQEALLNVVKHADVEDARVSLQVDDELIRAVVEDEGPGFDPESVRPDRGRHVGLGLLRERARLSGGALTVSSQEGAGTVLTLVLPRPSLTPSLAADGLDPAEFFESASE